MLVCLIGVCDVVLPRGIPLLLAYILPIALIGVVASRQVILLAAVICTTVSELTDAYVWNVREGLVRDSITLIALVGVGLYVREFVTKQESEHAHLQALSKENAHRIEAEEQLSLLIGSSALAILTMAEDGIVLQTNAAAHLMFAGTRDAGRDIVGMKVSALLPSLGRVMARAAEGKSMRMMMQSHGVRLDGEPFLAEVWFSNYLTRLGGRTAAMVVDISEEFRSREESIAEQLLDNSRLAVGAMAHEMRNVVGAIQMVLQSLASEEADTGTSASIPTLRELLSTLETMASVQLSQVKRTAARISLNQFLSELRVVAQAILSENGIEFFWEISGELPPVWADTEGLMQVFLNLLRNARTALANQEAPELRISSSILDNHVAVTVSDNGPGVKEPARLFHPFQPSGSVTSLGLYLSRAILNSFHGDLRLEPTVKGARFVVELEVARA